MLTRQDLPAYVVGVAALASAAWTVASGVASTADAMTAVLVPALFVIAGLAGALWNAARFTCRLVLGVGAAHLLGFAASAAALVGAPGELWWHTASQVLFVGGFALLVPLAAGFPAGPAPRWTVVLGVACAVVPLVGALAAPTPTVLSVTGPSGDVVTLGPLVRILPPEVAASVGIVFALPVVAAAVTILRLIRGGRELRGRLTLPLAALCAVALLIAAGSVLPASAAGISTALFLVSAPLVPVGIIAGSRPATIDATELEALRRLRERAAASDRVTVLTPRERDVLRLMAEGCSNPAIGRSLHISLSAVEKHSTAIFAKLGFTDEPDTHRRVAAVVAYLRAVDR
jgi:DNA-binding CsgD family transcriptional regulator